MSWFQFLDFFYLLLSTIKSTILPYYQIVNFISLCNLLLPYHIPLWLPQERTCVPPAVPVPQVENHSFEKRVLQPFQPVTQSTTNSTNPAHSKTNTETYSKKSDHWFICTFCGPAGGSCNFVQRKFWVCVVVKYCKQTNYSYITPLLCFYLGSSFR